MIVKGTKAQAEAIRDECREILEDKLKLTLNMEKTHVTHVNDGFVFLGHRIIRKRNRKGEMRISSSIPNVKAKNFIAKLTKELSSNYSMSKIDMVDKINRKLKGWSNFYRYTDYTAMVYNKVDRVIFWKLGHWLARKYRCSMKSIMRRWCKHPEQGKAKTWVLFGKTDNGNLSGKSLFRLVSSPKMPFRFRLPECNPYLRDDDRKTVTSRYDDVAMAISHC